MTLYSYNGSHRLQSIIDLPVNRTNSFTWNSDGSMASHTDPRNMVETYFWDNLHRLTGTSDSRGAITNLYYLISGTPYPNSSGGTAILDLTATKDRLGHWTSYVYDGLRRKITETNANGAITAYSYCSCGSVSSITNAWNTAVQEVTTFSFDNQGRLTTNAYADNYNVTNWYDSLGRVIVTGDGAANHWFSYNNLGLMTTRSNAYGAELVQSFDLLNRPVYVTDGNGVMITNVYDNLDRLLSRGYPDGGVERFGYSAKGLIAYTNQINATNFHGYDELGRKTYETNANGEILKFTNSAASDLLSLTDGKNQTTKWAYDSFGRVTSKTNQAGSVVIIYTYDPADRLTNRWSAAFGNNAYSYDAVGNLTQIYYTNSTPLSYSYDSLNRVTNMSDAVGTSTFTYTLGNQLLTDSSPWSSSTVTNFHSNRLRTGLSLQAGRTVWTNGFTYDAAGRVSNVLSPAGTFVYSYAFVGPQAISKISLPNTSYVTNTFDSVTRMTGTFLKNSANTVLDSATYGYNTANQRTTYTNAAGTYVNYGYDNIGQLLVANSSVSTENRGYYYDAGWNLNRRTNNGTPTTFSVDVQNQLTSGPASAYAYDANGNIASTSSGLSYSYDDENRLTTIISTNNYRTILTYDGLGRMRTREDDTWNGTSWITGTANKYQYDGTVVISGGGTGGFYTRGIDLSGTLQGAGGIGGLLAATFGFGGVGVAHYYYHSDANGNVTYLVDKNQAMAANYRYDPFGNTISSGGSEVGANLFRFSGKEQFSYSGLYVYLYRLYDPTVQRWLNRDPVEEDGGINLYGYVGNEPIDEVDPLGLQLSGSATLALDPTLLMDADGVAAYNAARAAAAAAALAAGAAASGGDRCETRQYGKGERNWQHDSDKWKGWKVDPTNPKRIKGKDQNGKDIFKPRPPDFPDPTPKPQPPKTNPPKPPEGGK